MSTGINLGTLGFRVGGSATLEDLSADTIGGEVGGDLSITSDIGNLTINNQFDANFSGTNGNGSDGLFVAGDATIVSGSGNLGQTAESPIIVGGLLDLSLIHI